MNTLKTLALILVIIGGLNWGLIGFMNFNLVTAIFGSATMLTKIIYDLVGLAAIYLAFISFAGKKPKENPKQEF